MKKNTFKIIFDVVLALGTVLLYKKNVLGLGFHELAGIAVCVLFVVHHLINRKWIAAVTKNLFSKTTPAKTRIEYIVDVLLCLSFLGVLITGIGISKKYLSTLAFLGNKGKIWHFFFSGCALILTGIHVGLHWKWISGTVLGKNKDKVSKPVHIICIVIFVAMMAGGCYALCTSSMKRWLSDPFTSSVSAQEQGGQKGQMMKEGGRGFHGDSEKLPEGFSEGRHEKGKDRSMDSNMPDRGVKQNQKISFKDVLFLILRYTGILIFFAGFTAVIEWLIKKFRAPKSQDNLPL